MPFLDCALGTKEIFTFLSPTFFFSMELLSSSLQNGTGVFPIYLPLLTLACTNTGSHKMPLLPFDVIQKTKGQEANGACHCGQYSSNGIQEPFI